MKKIRKIKQPSNKHDDSMLSKSFESTPTHAF